MPHAVNNYSTNDMLEEISYSMSRGYTEFSSLFVIREEDHIFSENYDLDDFVSYNLPSYPPSPMRQVPNDVLQDMFEDPAMKSVLKWRSKITTANDRSTEQGSTDKTSPIRSNMTNSRGSITIPNSRNNSISCLPSKDHPNTTTIVTSALQAPETDLLRQTPLSRKRRLSGASEDNSDNKRMFLSSTQESSSPVESTSVSNSPVNLFQPRCTTNTSEATWTSAIDSLNNLESELQHRCYRNCAIEYGHLCGTMTPTSVEVMDMRS